MNQTEIEWAVWYPPDATHAEPRVVPQTSEGLARKISDRPWAQEMKAKVVHRLVTRTEWRALSEEMTWEMPGERGGKPVMRVTKSL